MTPTTPTHPHVNECDESDGYVKLSLDVTNNHYVICVHVHFDSLSWQAARNVCQSENAELAVADSTMKSLILQQNLVAIDSNGTHFFVLFILLVQWSANISRATYYIAMLFWFWFVFDNMKRDEIIVK